MKREHRRVLGWVRKGRWHAVCNTDVMQWRTRPQKSRATHRRFTPFYAPPRLHASLRSIVRVRLDPSLRTG